MGNTFFCERCDIEKFKLSRACADQFLHDEENEHPTGEDRWRLKLKCLDDVHSRSLGITEENFNELFSKLQRKLKSLETEKYCTNSKLVIECLAKNPHCMLNCTKEMNDFVECVDTIRIKKLKERIQEAMLKRRTNSLPK